jgi:glutathione S-transferase
MDWQQTTFDPGMNPIFLGLVRAPGSLDDEAIENKRPATERNIAILETCLSQRSLIAGDTFGMADLTLAPPRHRWFNLPIARTLRRHFERWYERLVDGPAAREVSTLPITRGRRRAISAGSVSTAKDMTATRPGKALAWRGRSSAQATGAQRTTGAAERGPRSRP